MRTMIICGAVLWLIVSTVFAAGGCFLTLCQILGGYKELSLHNFAVLFLFGGLFLVFLQATFAYSEYLNSGESASAAPLSESARISLEKSLNRKANSGETTRQKVDQARD